jgi:hypothetical protein
VTAQAVSAEVAPLPVRPRIINGCELEAAVYPPLRWAVPGLVPEGLSLLVGPPKAGKSWAALDVALAVAAGGRALGALPCEEGDALYLALEDSERRLQDRVRLLLGDGTPFPVGLHLATGWPRGLDAVREVGLWAAEHPGARLVVVDTLARVRAPAGLRAGSAYEEDTAALVPWQKLAVHYGLAVVLVHHDRKATVTDFVDAVSGTHGLAGVADSTLVLDRARMENYGRLLLTGRDVQEREVSLQRTGPSWQVYEGPIPDDALGDLSARILRAVAAQPEGAKAADVATAVEGDPETVRRYLARLAESGRLQKKGRGLYTAPVPSVPSVPSQEESLW